MVNDFFSDKYSYHTHTYIIYTLCIKIYKYTMKTTKEKSIDWINKPSHTHKHSFDIQKQKKFYSKIELKANEMRFIKME